MEKKRTKSPTLREFQARFPTEDACLDHMMRVRYGERHTCAKCEREARYYRVKARRSYECEFCGHQVYPTAGTPFHKTRTSLRDWFYVMFLFTTTRNGVAAKRVQREIGVTYKTAWRMCHLIRHYMGYVDGDDMLGGPNGQPVEVDHAFFGGETVKKDSYRNKAVVMGMIERGGDVITRHIPARTSANVARVIKTSLKANSRVSSDADVTFGVFTSMGHKHTEVKQVRGTYSKETNSIEGYWSMVKRGISGTYISVSQKHLQSYLSEFEFRHNLRKQPHLMLDLLLQSFPRGA